MDFDTAFDRLLGNEGGYVNDPHDPGGETKWGISKASYPDVDIEALTKDDAKAIYRRDFWDHIHADDLAPGIAFQAFDFAVNSGIKPAVRALQRAIGVPDDGLWGPTTHDAAAALSVPVVMMRFIAERLDFWTALDSWPRYGRGWAKRAARDLRWGAEDV